MDISSYFRILFTGEKIQRDKLKRFTEDHIRRLSANNPKGVFTRILNDVSGCYLAYFGPTSDSQISELVETSKRENKALVKSLLVEDIKSLYPYIAYKFSSNRDVIDRFYPQGPETFKNGTPDLMLEQQIETFSSAIRDYESDFLPADVNDFYNLETTYRSNTNGHGDVVAEPEIESNTETRLRIQLTKNALTIAMHYVGFPEKGKDYFNPALLF